MEQGGKAARKVIQTRQKAVFLAGTAMHLLLRSVRAEFFPDVHAERLFTVSSAWSGHGMTQLVHPPLLQCEPPRALQLCSSQLIPSFPMCDGFCTSRKTSPKLTWILQLPSAIMCPKVKALYFYLFLFFYVTVWPKLAASSHTFLPVCQAWSTAGEFFLMLFPSFPSFLSFPRVSRSPGQLWVVKRPCCRT